jgi:hypothetical protein
MKSRSYAHRLYIFAVVFVMLGTIVSPSMSLACDGNPATRNFSIHMEAGWNFISIPIQPTNCSIETVLADVRNKAIAAYYFDPIKRSYDTWIDGQANNTLKRIEAGKAYWIYSTQTGTFTVKGNPASKSVKLYAEVDNHIGINSTVSMNIRDVINKNFDQELLPITIWTFDVRSNQCLRWSSNLTDNANTLHTFTPGKGYIVAATWFEANLTLP